MKNVLFVVDERKMGGVSILLEDIMRSIKLKNINVDILVLHNNGDRLETIKNANIIYGTKYFEIVDLSIKEILKMKNLKLLIKKAILFFDLKTGLIKYKIKKQRKKILNKQYDIEIAFKDGFTALFVGFGNAKRKIHWLHYDYKLENPNIKYNKLFKKILPTFDKIIAVSSGVMNDFNDVYSLNNKTSVISNLVDIEKIKNMSNQTMLEEKDDKINIISVGRLHHMKGYDRLIDALNKLNLEDCLQNVSVKLYGDGPEYDNLLNKINENKLEKIVFLKGRTNNPYKFIKNSDLFISSSIFEPFGLVIIEALTLGVPVIATKNSATNDLIKNNLDGIIVENSTEGIYKGLKDVLTDKNKLLKLKSNAEKFNYESENKKIVKQLEDLIQGD